MMHKESCFSTDKVLKTEVENFWGLSLPSQLLASIATEGRQVAAQSHRSVTLQNEVQGAGTPGQGGNLNSEDSSYVNNRYVLCWLTEDAVCITYK